MSLIAYLPNADIGFALFGLIFGVAVGSTGDCRKCRYRRRREDMRWKHRHDSPRKPW